MERCNDLYLLFSKLLEYPTKTLKQQADECAHRLAETCPPAQEAMDRFRGMVEQLEPERLEEIYTYTFELYGVCCPYVGYYLFGESYKRSSFMSQLNKYYRRKGFSAGCELPDHVAVILRFLAHNDMDEFSLVLLDEGLMPALSIMERAFGKNNEHPYRQVIQALSLVLEGSSLRDTRHLAGVREGG